MNLMTMCTYSQSTSVSTASHSDRSDLAKFHKGFLKHIIIIVFSELTFI